VPTENTNANVLARNQSHAFNPLAATVKPQSNGPLYSNTVIGILTANGWAVTFGTARRGLGGASVPKLATSYYSMWHYNYLCTLNG